MDVSCNLGFLRQDELHGHLQQERRQLGPGRSRQVVGVDIPEQKHWSQGGSVDKVFVGVCPNYIVSTFYWGRVRLVLRSWRLAEYWDVVIWIQHDKAIPQFSLKHQHVLVIVVLPHQAFWCLLLLFSRQGLASGAGTTTSWKTGGRAATCRSPQRNAMCGDFWLQEVGLHLFDPPAAHDCRTKEVRVVAAKTL